MSDNVRREIILVPYPVPVGGSNKMLREVKPLPFQRNQPTHWRPANCPPKTNATVSLLRRMVEQEAAVRRMMQPQHQR